MSDICIIGVYFGKLPDYFSLWLKSCEYNESIDFLVVTDQAISEEYKLPQNVRCYHSTLPDMKRLAAEKLGFSVSLDRPYKCCDYKVIYGLLFEDLLSEYAYWGHCDFDLIWGDLRSFFGKYDLYQYDKFLALGHLSLYRNTRDVLFRFQLDGAQVDYRTVYSSDKSYAFDETMGLAKIYADKGFSMFTKCVFADISAIYSRYRLVTEYPLDKKPENYKKQIFYWENGKVLRSYYKGQTLETDEFMYIHFKKRPNFPVDFDSEKVNAFYITNKGFYEKNQQVDEATISMFNDCSWGTELKESIRYNVKKYTRAVRKRLSQ